MRRVSSPLRDAAGQEPEAYLRGRRAERGLRLQAVGALPCLHLAGSRASCSGQPQNDWGDARHVVNHREKFFFCGERCSECPMHPSSLPRNRNQIPICPEIEERERGAPRNVHETSRSPGESRDGPAARRHGLPQARRIFAGSCTRNAGLQRRTARSFWLRSDSPVRYAVKIGTCRSA